LVQFINSLPDYYTTSSCSGRISIYIEDREHTKGIEWLLVQHCTVSLEDVHKILSNSLTICQDPNLIFFKCECFILHIACRTIEAGSILQQIALSCGFRESGLTLGQKKTMLAIRTTSFCLESPILDSNRELVSFSVLKTIVVEANRKLLQNFSRIDRFFESLKNHFQWPILRVFNEKPFDDNAPGLQKWGFSAITLPARQASIDDSLLIFGGYGTSVDGASTNKRGHFLMMAQISEVAIRWNDADESKQLNDPSMHAAVATGNLPCIDSFIILSGGRQSLEAPFPCVRHVYDAINITKQLQFIEYGDIPPPRWGHSLSSISNASFLLIGGRNHDAIFEDAYILTCESTSVSNLKETALSLTWTRLSDDAYCDCSPTPRFFHAACTLRDVMKAETISNLVLIHGGLASLNFPKSLNTSMIFYPAIRKFFPLQSTLHGGSKDDSADLNSTSKIFSSVNRFAHTMIYIGTLIYTD
jgi:tRNA wybutosine-synthesizing protein 3